MEERNNIKHVRGTKGIQRKPNGKQQTQNMSIFMTKYKGFKYPIKTQR